jgi:hypothetical protein
MIPYKAYYISPFILEQGRALQHATNDVFLKGVMDVGTNNRIVWKNVPSTISIHGGKTITISVADNATNHHFASQPVFGLVTSFTHVAK